MIQAQILADSINPQGDRITTMKVTFPRIVLAEFNTHRVFSRNSGSSRAIPFKKMLKMVRETPFIPTAFQKNHKGMQGKEYFTNSDDIAILEQKWLRARDKMVESVLDLAAGVFSLNEVFDFDTEGELITKQNVVGVTKQLINRLLEPFMWHTVIVTATEWGNFFKLRCPNYRSLSKWIQTKAGIIKSNANSYHKSRKGWLRNYERGEKFGRAIPQTELEWLQCNTGQAEIHISLLAEKMYDALNESTPKELKAGEWHIPFGDNIDEIELANLHSGLVPLTQDVINQMKLQVAVARCARISYQTFGDNPKIDYAADIKLHDMLASNGHASPFEHVARCMSEEEYKSYNNGKLLIGNEYYHPTEDSQGWCRNFKGFIQYREILENGV